MAGNYGGRAACRYCGKKGLVWRLAGPEWSRKWRLAEVGRQGGQLHKCKVYKEKKKGEKVIAKAAKSLAYQEARKAERAESYSTLEGWSSVGTGKRMDTRDTWAAPKLVSRTGKRREVLEP